MGVSPLCEGGQSGGPAQEEELFVGAGGGGRGYDSADGDGSLPLGDGARSGMELDFVGCWVLASCREDCRTEGFLFKGL